MVPFLKGRRNLAIRYDATRRCLQQTICLHSTFCQFQTAAFYFIEFLREIEMIPANVDPTPVA